MSSEKKSSGTNNRARQNIIMVRVSAEEQDKIKAKAGECSLTTPEYLRKLGMEYQPVSTLDKQSISELAKLRGDLGRMGGLLRSIFYDKQDVTLSITELVDSIRKTQALIAEKVEAL